MSVELRWQCECLPKETNREAAKRIVNEWFGIASLGDTICWLQGGEFTFGEGAHIYRIEATQERGVWVWKVYRVRPSPPELKKGR